MLTKETLLRRLDRAEDGAHRVATMAARLMDIIMNSPTCSELDRIAAHEACDNWFDDVDAVGDNLGLVRNSLLNHDVAFTRR